jgi:hypothetical protein
VKKLKSEKVKKFKWSEANGLNDFAKKIFLLFYNQEFSKFCS